MTIEDEITNYYVLTYIRILLRMDVSLFPSALNCIFTIDNIKLNHNIYATSPVAAFRNLVMLVLVVIAAGVL